MTVVSPVFNRQAEVRQSLDSILKAIRAYGDAELVLVDNGSTDGTYEMLQSEYAPHAQVHQRKGVSIAALRNLGAQQGKGDVLCFLDSDCLVEADYLDRVVAVLNREGAAATGSMVFVLPGVHWIEETWDKLNSRRTDNFVHFLGSGNFAVRREAFEKVGGFEESLVTGEDAEICMKLVAAGYGIFQSQEVRAIHLRNTDRIKDFYDKQVWYGLGMFGSFKVSLLDKPVLMTFAHLLLNVAAVAALFAPLPLAGRITAVPACALAVPAVSVLYRYKEQRIFYRPLRSLLLYTLFFYGRVWALLRIAVGRGR